jgi:hypothetical protein
MTRSFSPPVVLYEEEASWFGVAVDSMRPATLYEELVLI